METALEIGIPISSSDSSYGRLYFYGEVCQYAGGVLSGGASGCDGDGRIYRLLSGGAGSAVGAGRYRAFFQAVDNSRGGIRRGSIRYRNGWHCGDHG